MNWTAFGVGVKMKIEKEPIMLESIFERLILWPGEYHSMVSAQSWKAWIRNLGLAMAISVGILATVLGLAAFQQLSM